MKISAGFPLPLGVSCHHEAVNFSIAVPQGKSCQLHLFYSGKEEPAYTYELLAQDGIGDVRFILVRELDIKIDEYLYVIDGIPTIDPNARELTNRFYGGFQTKLNRPMSHSLSMEDAVQEAKADATRKSHYLNLTELRQSHHSYSRESQLSQQSNSIEQQLTQHSNLKAMQLSPPFSSTQAQLKSELYSGKRAFGQTFDGVRGRFRISSFDWKQDRRPNHKHSDVIAYSIHVRGFTKHKTSKVKHKGTFAGIKEKLPYLIDLGVNQIQLMPVYEFDESLGSKVNYWGYGAGYYYAPKTSYSASSDPSRELKELIYQCHQHGIEVILEMPFDAGVAANQAIDILRFYMLEYHVDGFVVIPYYVSWEMLKEDPLIKGVKLYRKDDDFRNVMRRFLKGDENTVNDVMRVLTSNTAEDGRLNYITGHTGFTLMDLVCYDGKHNEANGENNNDGPDYNYSWNCGAEGPSRKRDVIATRKNQLWNAWMLLLSAQGTPVLLQGDEFGNSQKGNNNVYCQDNELSWINWSSFNRQAEMFTFVKGLIAFRKACQALHQDFKLQGLDTFGSGIPDISYHGDSPWNAPNEVASRRLGVLFCGSRAKDVDVYIAYNMHWIEHTFALPTLPKRRRWFHVVDTAKGVYSEPIELVNQKNIDLSPRTIVILIGK